MNERDKLEAAAKAAGISLEWFEGRPMYRRGKAILDWEPEQDSDDSEHMASLCGITLRPASATSGMKAITAIAPDGSHAIGRDYNVHAAARKAVFNCAVLLGEKLP